MRSDHNNNHNIKQLNTAMSSSKKTTSCNMSKHCETSTHSALASGRWVVHKDEYTKTLPTRVYLLKINEATLERYQMGETSLGLDMGTFRPDVLLYRLVPSRPRT
jgi:hypothetical protein